MIGNLAMKVSNDALAENHESAGTLASGATEKLRVAIVTGKFRPGERLRVETLCELLEAGSSPVREALNRLAAEGLVDQHDQRGFWVPPVSWEELEELTRTRCWINEVCLRKSIGRGDTAWEEQIVIALHRLNQVARTHDINTKGASPDWDRLHRAFHRALISACDSRILLDFADSLSDRAQRYRYIATAVGSPTRDIVGEHCAIANAVIARDAESAVELMNEHLGSTMRRAGSIAESAAKPAAGQMRKRRAAP